MFLNSHFRVYFFKNMFVKRIKLKRFTDLRFNMKLRCPECGSAKIAKSMGEVSCRKCGLVLDENIIMSY